MKYVILMMLILLLLIQPVHAMDITAPTAPESAEEFMPKESISFWKDLLFVINKGLDLIAPSLTSGSGCCLSVIAIALLVSLFVNLSSNASSISGLVGTLSIGIILMQSTNAMIDLGVSTITELTGYGKLLLPVLTTALAAQGGVSTSTALYVGTAFFSTLLSSLISKVLVPMLYLYLCFSVAYSAINEETLKRFRDSFKWLHTWSMKTILYVFAGFMTLTGVVSGTVDATAVKAARLTISGCVPVVGKILSDASETILVSAGIMKNTAGVYGILALSALIIGPFIRIGTQYLLLKFTAAVCSTFSTKSMVSLIDDFSSGMGFILAMTSVTCLLLMISVVCFMKGAS